MIEKFEYLGYTVSLFVYDGDPERLPELWIELDDHYIGAIRFRSMKPSQENVMDFIDEYLSEMSLGVEP
jgi:hypothetical protein